jgi:hypothetical protein
MRGFFLKKKYVKCVFVGVGIELRGERRERGEIS